MQTNKQKKLYSRKYILYFPLKENLTEANNMEYISNHFRPTKNMFAT